MWGAGEVERFRAIADERRLTNVTFAGAVSDAERVALLHGSDVFALPSHAEGQPIAILEAMAAGLPILSSTVGSIPEVVREPNGMLVAPGDVERDLGGARAPGRRPLAPRAARAVQRARRRPVKYDLPRVFREIDAVYGEL